MERRDFLKEVAVGAGVAAGATIAGAPFVWAKGKTYNNDVVNPRLCRGTPKGLTV